LSLGGSSEAFEKPSGVPTVVHDLPLVTPTEQWLEGI
jgi:hypothetical protein